MERPSRRKMTNIKNSLEKLRAASKLLEQTDCSDPYDQEKVQSLRDALTELNQNMEEFKSGINNASNAPIRFNK